MKKIASTTSTTATATNGDATSSRLAIGLASRGSGVGACSMRFAPHRDRDARLVAADANCHTAVALRRGHCTEV
ncbi:MAG TPA: hypothetical protein VFU71_17905 [Burkholderiaceae bacterium]|nr:hypothetical protein [Burkholderiaceae bacterium]